MPLGQTAVYRCYDEDRLLYVGASFDVERRIRDHRTRSAWWLPSIVVAVTWYDSRTVALDAEAVAIRMERPAWNHTHLSGWSTSTIKRRWRPSTPDQSAALRRVASSTDPIERRAAVLVAWDLGIPPVVVAQAARGKR